MQEIDSDVGFSHRAILYRFGSRDGFTHALAQDVVDVLEADVRTALARPTADVVSVLEHVVATLGWSGLERLIALRAFILEAQLPEHAGQEKHRRLIHAP